jgi:hypothetical protein
MKKKSPSQSAFFNLRGLIGLFMALAGVFLGLLGFGVFSPTSTAQAQQRYKPAHFGDSVDPLVPVMFDCSKIHELGIDKQENFRAGAIMIYCGEAQGGTASPGGTASRLVEKLLSPLAYGTTDVDLITGPETYPHVTQSETFVATNPDNLQQIVIAYNDSRGRNANPINVSGASVSLDGGSTFTRITGANGQSPFSNTVGDPVILYQRTSGTWFTVWIDLECGMQGLGGYKSTNPSDPTSWTHYCVHTGNPDDRESGWVDNNPSSPHYGRMYVSWNDFARGQAIFVRYSDDGVTWTETGPLPGTGSNPFIRNVQITGDLATGDVYIAAMNENGGAPNFNRNNLIYRSTDGGITFTNTYTGPTFFGPGRATNSYYACMYGSGTSGYWRHMGWGEPAAYNHVVHYVYAQCGQNVTCPSATDHGDVYYIRSTDSGVTFGTPVKLNTDTGTAAQWEPNLSVSPSGTVFAVWYDERTGGACTAGSNTPCYQMFARKSNDNGLTWMPDMAFSDVVSPLPAQPDPGIQAPYVGDYDYQIGIATSHRTGWVDGRVAINNVQQQNAFADRELVGFEVISPACGNFVVGTPPTEFAVNLNEPVDPTTVDATDFTVNNIPANSFAVMNGNMTIDFIYNTSPAVQGQNTMHIPYCAFRSAFGECVLEFLCMFRYGQTQLAVTSTNPPVGGTFSPPAPGDYQYDVNWNIPVDPSSVHTSDLTITGMVGGSVTAVSVIKSNMTTRFTVHFNFGGSATMSIAAGAITDSFGNPNAAFSGNYAVLGCPPAEYVITPGTDPIVPGTQDLGNHCDDCATTVALPFPVQLYNQIYTSIEVVSNGFINFVSPNTSFSPACLPVSGFDFTIFPLWHDWRTDVGLSGCSTFSNGCGIFTSISGTAPHRIVNFEWHAVRFADNTQTGDFEVRLYENPVGTNGRFDVIYGASSGTPGAGDAAGVQGNSGSGFLTQDFCNVAAPQNVSRAYTFQPCAAMASSAFSRKVHGAAGTFDIPLPLTGNVGVECRTGPAYQMIVNFPGAVTLTGADVTSGTGIVSSFSGSGTSTITVNLSGVTDVQRITVTLRNVNDGTHTGDVPVSMGVLIGDVNGNAAVNASDVALTKSQVGQTVGNGNFRDDVNTSGTITATDVSIVKSDVGHSLPP